MSQLSVSLIFEHMIHSFVWNFQKLEEKKTPFNYESRDNIISIVLLHIFKQTNTNIIRNIDGKLFWNKWSDISNGCKHRVDGVFISIHIFILFPVTPHDFDSQSKITTLNKQIEYKIERNIDRIWMFAANQTAIKWTSWKFNVYANQYMVTMTYGNTLSTLLGYSIYSAICVYIKQRHN